MEPSVPNPGIQARIHACTEIYSHLQTSINSMQYALDAALVALPASDLTVVVSNIQAIRGQIADLEPYMRALQTILPKEDTLGTCDSEQLLAKLALHCQ